MKADNLQLWRIFCTVVEKGGVNAACEALDCEPSTVSRAVKTLEAELGVALFRREGRTLQLTDIGRTAYKRSLELIARHDEMVADLQGDRDTLSGSVKVATHAGNGPTTVTSALVNFLKTYPDMHIELHELNGMVPGAFRTAEGGTVDLVMSYGPETPIPGLVSRFVGEMPFVACTSPLYIKRFGAPQHPADCIHHTGILPDIQTRAITKSLECRGRMEELH